MNNMANNMIKNSFLAEITFKRSTDRILLEKDSSKVLTTRYLLQQQKSVVEKKEAPFDSTNVDLFL